ncbi:LytTR family transcriptional regulator DNA-binding domain-containing protein [Beduinella massiliensis]|uniref:LytTR family transcriptional regulator DNA-binding domain-containing protein n=1 Tax=Beduinella massiliensis TaxID=1852363 RepID=UPI000C8393E4
MKLTVEQNLDIRETEIIIRCALIDDRLKALLEQIRLYGFSITARREGNLMQIALEDIFYVESVDDRTFLYVESDVWECDLRLYELENQLKHTAFVRCAKNCILNTQRIQSVRALYNGRLEATLQNGERIVVTRHYVPAVKQRFGLKG